MAATALQFPSLAVEIASTLTLSDSSDKTSQLSFRIFLKARHPSQKLHGNPVSHLRKHSKYAGSLVHLECDLVASHGYAQTASHALRRSMSYKAVSSFSLSLFHTHTYYLFF